MAEQIVGEGLAQVAPPQDRREGLAALARRIYATIVIHPWLAVLFAAGTPLGPKASRQAEQLTAVLVGPRVSDEEAALIAATLTDYALGHALRIAADPQRRKLARAIADGGATSPPEFTALASALPTRAWVERFDAGLQLLLDGIELRIAADAAKGRSDVRR